MTHVNSPENYIDFRETFEINKNIKLSAIQTGTLFSELKKEIESIEIDACSCEIGKNEFKGINSKEVQLNIILDMYSESFSNSTNENAVESAKIEFIEKLDFILDCYTKN